LQVSGAAACTDADAQHRQQQQRPGRRRRGARRARRIDHFELDAAALGLDLAAQAQFLTVLQQLVVLLAVLCIGIGAGCGAAYLQGRLRSTFATASKLETALDLPVIGAISLAMTDAARAVQARRRKLFLAAAGGLGGLFVILLGAEFVQRGMVA
jgi:hypothetical protein